MFAASTETPDSESVPRTGSAEELWDSGGQSMVGGVWRVAGPGGEGAPPGFKREGVLEEGFEGA